ncbi:TetR family transcriptional regulator [Marinobacterium aestuarii]|uniref:TetR family transcriptional regulator n=2 Tax=Marinobacterium aestuarii TaxID=1821621 RepID=A0A1A9EY62_9GAMM|nr:TetR family transcriptional regulator [Marinobacterium aestuarii]
MDMLARMAQVSKRTVYNHFGSTEALIMHLISEMWRQATLPIGLSYDTHRPLSEQLCAVIEAEIAMIGATESIELNRVVFGHFFYQPDLLQREVQKFSAHETAAKRWIRAAHADKRLKDLDIEVASAQIHSLIKGSCFWPQLMQITPLLDAEQRHDLAERTAAIFLSHYAESQ